MACVIREAVLADVGALVGILIATKTGSLPHLVESHDLDVAFWTDRWRQYLAEGSRAQLALGDGFVLLAEAAGGPVGFAAFHHTRRHDADAELQALYVLPSCQRQGIGTALLLEVARRLAGDGSRSMCVGYHPANPFKGFYATLGAHEINPHWAVWRDLGALAERGSSTG
ncbi:MAG TPA: GNAT family N-acetyltransferase [Gemmatimonadales bacterium]|nr:GNAT family N-acetyltransferase [Gemmatimonadales bacterium]